MASDAFKNLEDVFPQIVRLIPEDIFDSHKFILVLAQEYQTLYIEALFAYRNRSRPFHAVHMAIAKRLNKHVNLVTHIKNRRSDNIFGQKSRVAVWQKVK